MRGPIMLATLGCTLLLGVLSCSAAGRGQDASFVRAIEPLKPSEHISFLETGGNDRVIHFFAEGARKAEIFAVGPLREQMPRLTADKRKAFFLVDDGKKDNGVDDLYFLDGDKGEIRKFPQVPSVYAISNDGEFICYDDYAYTLTEAKKGDRWAIRVVLFSAVERKTVAEFHASGVFFIYTEGKPAITFDQAGSSFLYKVLQQDSHVADYEMSVPSGTSKLLSVSKGPFAAP
jgi:hypothetical protein